MSQTATFTGASFDIKTVDGDPTNKLRASRLFSFNRNDPQARFQFRNSDRSTIERLNFGFGDGVRQSLYLKVSSWTPTSAKNSNFSFGELNDTLVIGSSKNNTFNMLNGNNVVKINGHSSGDTIGFGVDSDQLVFGRGISNTTVDLGGDQVIDQITISNRWAPVSGFVVKGASTGDILLVGSSRYTYNSNADQWQDRNGNAYDKISSS